jgi:hypothetical protein
MIEIMALDPLYGAYSIRLNAQGQRESNVSSYAFTYLSSPCELARPFGEDPQFHAIQ